MRGARSARTEVAFDLAPTVTVGGGYTRQRLSSATFPDRRGAAFPDQDIWDGGFDASWELDLFGRVRRNVQAQGAFVEVAQEGSARRPGLAHRRAGAGLLRPAWVAGAALGGAAERGEPARTLEVTRQRLEAGRGTAFDTERAQAQLSFTLATVPLLESRVAQAQYQIGVLVGRPPAAVAAELAAVATLPALPGDRDAGSPRLGDSQETGRGRRGAPAGGRAGAGGSGQGGVPAPDLTWAGALGYTAPGFDALGDGGTFRYAVGPDHLLAGAQPGPGEGAGGRVTGPRSRRRGRSTTRRCCWRCRMWRRRCRATGPPAPGWTRIEDAASASERAAELARARFSGGVADFLQVLDAERTQLEAQDQLAQGRTEAATAYAALYKALGGSSPSAN